MKLYKDLRLNWSAHADTQQQVAASRRLLRAGGLQRYVANPALHGAARK